MSNGEVIITAIEEMGSMLFDLVSADDMKSVQQNGKKLHNWMKEFADNHPGFGSETLNYIAKNAIDYCEICVSIHQAFDM